jgi:hypothetical protein
MEKVAEPLPVGSVDRSLDVVDALGAQIIEVGAPRREEKLHAASVAFPISIIHQEPARKIVDARSVALPAEGIAAGAASRWIGLIA